jgi:type III pantothenate kinase
MNLIVIDIGNSNIKIGLFSGSRLLRTGSIPSLSARAKTIRLLTAKIVGENRIAGSCISSVVPKLTYLAEKSVEELFSVHPLVVRGDMQMRRKNRYTFPARLGADRLCAAAGAFALYGGPTIVVDFGTATTYNVIDKHGNFLGGVISPGVNTIASALPRVTAQLPEISFRVPSKTISRDTITSLQAGTSAMAIDAFEGMILRLRTEFGVRMKVVATGGYAALMAKHTGLISRVEKNLVLIGGKELWWEGSSRR